MKIRKDLKIIDHSGAALTMPPPGVNPGSTHSWLITIPNPNNTDKAILVDSTRSVGDCVGISRMLGSMNKLEDLGLPWALVNVSTREIIMTGALDKFPAEDDDHRSNLDVLEDWAAKALREMDAAHGVDTAPGIPTVAEMSRIQDATDDLLSRWAAPEPSSTPPPAAQREAHTIRLRLVVTLRSTCRWPRKTGLRPGSFA